MKTLTNLQPTAIKKSLPVTIQKVIVNEGIVKIVMSDGRYSEGRIVVDGLFFKQRSGVRRCHLAGDSIEHLHLFAKACGIKQHHFENKRGRNQPHYDITEKEFEFVKKKGIPVIGKEILSFLKMHYDNVERGI